MKNLSMCSGISISCRSSNHHVLSIKLTKLYKTNINCGKLPFLWKTHTQCCNKKHISIGVFVYPQIIAICSQETAHRDARLSRRAGPERLVLHVWTIIWLLFYVFLFLNTVWLFQNLLIEMCFFFFTCFFFHFVLVWTF